MDHRLKRQMLRQAIDENLSTIEGKPVKAPAPTKTRRRPAWLRWTLVSLLPVLVAVVVWAALPLASVPSSEQRQTIVDVPPDDLDDSLDLTDHLRFPAPRPIDMRAFPVAIERILLDPGHGGDDHGTVGGALAEKTLTLDIAQRLSALLEEDGLEVDLTRRDDRLVSLKERAAIANAWQADLFVSIHINWLATQEVRGIETYYLGPTDDPRLIELARLENRESGYRLAEMKPLLSEIYTDHLQGQSLLLARRVQRSLFASLHKVNPQLKDRGVKTAPFVVLVSTEMPAILAEVSCLSNREEEELLSRPYYRDHIAQALARGIRGYADDLHQIEEKGS